MAVYSQATESPSPVAVTVKVYQLAGTAVVAESVSVDEPVFEFNVTGLLLHAAVTPLGRPEIAKPTVPWKEPPAVNVKTSVADPPCTTGRCVTAGEKLSVGAVKTTVNGSPCAAE
jgi:hypothetical protein